MYYLLSEHFSGMLLFLCMIQYDLSYSNVTVSDSSEEIKRIFSLTHDNNTILKGTAVAKNFAEGGLIYESLKQFGSKTSYQNSTKNLPNGHENEFEFTGVNKQNTSYVNNQTRNKSYNSPAASSKVSLPTKLIESGSNLFLGVPEVIHINGTSSIKPRKGVHYSKIVPRKGVDNENEAFHVMLENQSCFWVNEKECYINKGIPDLKCNCCKLGNVLGENVKQSPVKCNYCRTDKILSKGNQTCKNICCNSVNHNFYSVELGQNTYNNYMNYSTLSNAEKIQHYSYHTEISEKIMVAGEFQKNTITKKNDSLNYRNNSKFKPDITKVPYDAESMTELLSETQQKVFVLLAVLLFLLPLLGIMIFFFWQKTKDYWNKRYYKRMDFLIDGIYND